MIMLNKEIEVIALTDSKGMIRPYKFRIEDTEGNLIVYKVDTVLFRKKETVNKSTSIIIRCRGIMDGLIKEYELKFDVQNTRWFLYCI